MSKVKLPSLVTIIKCQGMPLVLSLQDLVVGSLGSAYSHRSGHVCYLRPYENFCDNTNELKTSPKTVSNY